MTSDPTPTFGFASSETNSTFECRVDGGTFASCPDPYTVAPALDEGAHTFQVRAVNQMGNFDPTPVSFGFRVDTVAPTATITSGPDGVTRESSPTFTYTSSESGSTFECKVDSGAFTTCAAGSAKVGPLADGPHSFAVRATDSAGNQGQPVSRDFSVDTKGTLALGKPVPDKKKGTATLAVTANAPGTVEATGSGIKTATATVGDDGKATLVLKATGRAKKQLKKKGKAKVAVKVVFSPTLGSSAEQTVTVKLAKKRKK